MFFLILALLSVLQPTNPFQTSTKDKDYFKNTTILSIVCDDDMMKNIGEKLEDIGRENENLRLKIDTMNMIMNHHFMELKSATTTATRSSTPTTKTSQNCDDSFDHLIDIRGNFNEDDDGRQSSCTPSKFDLPSSCAEALQQSGRLSGVHKIRISESKLEPFYVNCLADPEKVGAAWTIIQRRQDGHIKFNRTWVDYQQGFGNLEREFFIGLDKLHALTQSTLHELWIKMEDFENVTRSAKYSSFAIGGASEAYALNVLGSYSGDAGDSLSLHAGFKFRTHDMDDDIHCGREYKGGWWFGGCLVSNLNGEYLTDAYPKDKYGHGIVWYTFHEKFNYSLKYDHMALRSVSISKANC